VNLFLVKEKHRMPNLSLSEKGLQGLKESWCLRLSRRPTHNFRLKSFPNRPPNWHSVPPSHYVAPLRKPGFSWKSWQNWRFKCSPIFLPINCRLFFGWYLWKEGGGYQKKVSISKRKPWDHVFFEMQKGGCDHLDDPNYDDLLTFLETKGPNPIVMHIWEKHDT